MSQTVFILGAGASREAGGPLMADFLDTADELRKSTDLKDDLAVFDLVFRAISSLQNTHSKSTLDIYNIESVFAAFEMASLLGRLGSLEQKDLAAVGLAIRRLIVRTLEERIELPLEERTVKPPFPYGDFVSLVSGLPRPVSNANAASTSIISFNYDLALDYALYYNRLRMDYCLELSNDRNRIQFMKLHGSLNWARCNHCKRIIPWHLEEFFAKRQWNLGIRNNPKSVRLEIGSLLKEFVHCGNPVVPEPLIVPPTWNKTQYHQEISHVWSQAAKNLSEAENIFVIGYSLPDTDQFFRYLYALGTVGESLLKRFWVFDPDPQVGKRFEGLLGETARARFKLIQGKFSEAIGLLRNHFNMT